VRQGVFNHVKKGKDVCPKRLFQLLPGHILDRFSGMLLGGIVDDDI